jgi:hypothetical protein
MPVISIALSERVGELARWVLAGGALAAVLSRLTLARRPAARGALRQPATSDSPLSASTRQASAVISTRVPLADRSRPAPLAPNRHVLFLPRAPETARQEVAVFVDRLDDLPGGRWIEIGRARLSPLAALHRAAAFASLEAAIEDQRLGVAAWHVRDAVATSAILARRTIRGWTRAERLALAAAHGAAEGAALAILARCSLAPEDFNVLCAQFAEDAHTAVREWTGAQPGLTDPPVIGRPA